MVPLAAKLRREVGEFPEGQSRGTGGIKGQWRAEGSEADPGSDHPGTGQARFVQLTRMSCLPQRLQDLAELA